MADTNSVAWYPRLVGRLAKLAQPSIALPATLLLALALRLWDLRQPFIGDQAWNEVYYAYIARSFYHNSLLIQRGITAGLENVSSSPLVPWLIYGSFRLFGVTEWAARLPFLVCGLLSLICLYWLTRITAKSARLALVALLVAATSPGIVFFSRNVQLDGVMTAFGLGALLMTALYRQTQKPIYALASIFLMALSILAKFSGVLFFPALAWLWFGQGTAWRDRRRWLSLAGFAAVALLPAILWLAYSSTRLLSAGATSHYLLRFDEWRLSYFKAVALSLWPVLLRQFGSLGTSAGLVLALFALATVSFRRLLRHQALPLLLTIPWFLQMAYPRSWVANEYYTYPALYGLSLVLAALGLAGFERVSEWLRLTPTRQATLAALLLGLAVFSNFWDYRDGFHQLYYPWPVIAEPQPFYSARLVAAANTANEPLLADVTATLYYAQADLDRDRYAWWADDDGPMIAAVQSRHYKYIVFKYPPTIGIMRAIMSSRYQQIAPAAWQRLDDSP